MGRLFSVLLVICAAGAAFAASTPMIPTPDPLTCFAMSGSATQGTVDVSGMPFSTALHLKTGAVASSANSWDIRTRCFSSNAAAKDDTGLAVFWMRTTASTEGKGYTTFVLERNDSPYTKSASFTVAAGSDWKKVEIPFSMAETYAANAYNFSFWITFPNQEIEIGGLTIQNYGNKYPYSSLNLTTWPYAGRAADAPWRLAAAARIEKYRKGDIVVVVKDDSGKPVANAQVHLKMKRHAFGFGTAVANDILSQNTSDADKYRQALKKLFNKVVTENALKWPDYESNKANADFMLNWFPNNGFTAVRGHNVIWPGKSFLPQNILPLLTVDSAGQLRTRINTHIHDVMAFAKGRLTEWDVINEPYANKDVTNILGSAEMAEWMKQARTEDPSVKLYVNDYNLLEAGGMDLPHIIGFYQILQNLIAEGAPLDGIGLQSHFDTNLTEPDRVLEVLDKFAGLGKDLQVTEFDINIGDDQVQADYTRDFLTTTFSHPAVKGFMIWGFWAGAHWLPSGAMINKDWTTKPNYDVWNDLIFKQWWTDVSGTSATDGTFRARGFLGDYDIEVTPPGGATKTYPLTAGSASQPAYEQTANSTAPAITLAGIGNAASYQTGTVAPGELVVIFGSNFGPATLAQAKYDDNFYLPTTIGDTRVLFDGAPAPMIYSWNGPNGGQLSAVAPYSLKDKTSTTIEVEYLGVRSNAVTVPVAKSAPGIFLCGNGTPVVINWDVYQTDPAHGNSCLDGYQAPRPGQTVIFFITGEGEVTPSVADGQYPGTTYPKPVQNVKITFGGVELDANPWLGMTYSGVTQVNATVPAAAPEGDAVPMVVTIGSVPSVEAKTTITKYKLLWADEFNGPAGSAPDSTKWGYDLGANGWGNAEWENYTNSTDNSYQDGSGNLVIKAIKSGNSYTSARLKTQGKFDFTYGKVEGRMKLPYGKGIWPAFWMLGNDIGTVGWPRCGEIDIMEYIGPSDANGNVQGPKVYGTAHAPPGPTSSGSTYTFDDPKFYDAYHVYAVEWAENSVKFMVDGNVYHEVTPTNIPGATWVFQHPFFVILNVAVGGRWPGYPDDTTVFPVQMTVDYVRVYQKQ